MTSTETSVPQPTDATTSGSSQTADVNTVQVFFSVGNDTGCAEVIGATRQIDAVDEPRLSAFEQLVLGPSETESQDGAVSLFSAASSAVVAGVEFADGLLVVDFVDLRQLLPNASTSCGSEALLAQLTNTAFQFEEVERVRFEMESSCDVFAAWLQRECFETNRGGDILAVETSERASGSGCSPSDAEGLPDGRWFGYMASATSAEISFDLACWFVGPGAAVAAAEDGAESPPPNDYYVRNQSLRLRTIPVADYAEVAWLPELGFPDSMEIATYVDWLDAGSERAVIPGLWLNIDDGEVISIEEQYVP